MDRVDWVTGDQTTQRNASTRKAQSPNKASFGVGLGGAVISSVCCLLPAAALAVGFGGAAGLVQLGKYQRYLLGVGLLFVGGWNWYLLERRKRCCTTADQQKALYFQFVLPIAMFLASYLLINHLLVPWLYGIRASGTPPM